ncbi:MAG TPA: ABC transporter substrate-binding protein [Devosia sp.]|nr:ABC transporter substrate-binding protein [Devosia sp.]
MTNSSILRAVTGAALGLVSAFAVTAAMAQEAKPTTPIDIGYVELAKNPMLDPERAYYMVPVRPFGSPLPGAELGIADAQTIGKVIGVDFGLKSELGDSIDDINATVRGWSGEGMNFVIADLPATELLALSDAVADLPVTIFNIAAGEDNLRGADCRANVVHMIPSFRMLTDATAQYLVSRHWKNILVLQGPSPADQQMVDAMQQSAKFFGARIVEVRPFLLSNDPTNRERGNVALVTGGTDYDVVYIADSDGEFARFAQYETNLPRPIVGAAGLTPKAWSWAYQKHGSSEVTQRFEQLVPRHMDDQDWAAWISTKAVVQSVLRTKNGDYPTLLAYMFGEKLNLDGGKGNPLSIRPWDHQLRQAIPLATTNAVLDEAPITGFLHQTNDLDTLGVDQPQSACRFPG